MTDDVPPSELYKTVKIGTDSDTISRAKAIEAVMECYDNDELFEVYEDKLRELPPAQPAQLEPDQNSDLWITVPDIDKVTRIYVQESKSKFCRIFYEEQPERIKGHWVNGCCDKCNAHAPFWCMATTYYESNFCPNCGAEMEVTT